LFVWGQFLDFDDVGVVRVIFSFEEGALVIEQIISFFGGLEHAEIGRDASSNLQEVSLMHKIYEIVPVLLMDGLTILDSFLDFGGFLDQLALRLLLNFRRVVDQNSIFFIIGIIVYGTL
jgi:hypothetical protein